MDDNRGMIYDNEARAYIPMVAQINKMMANDRQEGGGHYKAKAIQPWDYIISNNLGFLEGNVIKYVSRYKDKGGIEDLKKAQHYLEKLIEIVSN